MANNVLQNYATAGIPSNIRTLCQQWVAQHNKKGYMMDKLPVNIARDQLANQIVNTIMEYGRRVESTGYAGTTKKDMKSGAGNFEDYAKVLAAQGIRDNNFVFSVSTGLPYIQGNNITQAFVNGVAQTGFFGKVATKTGTAAKTKELDKMTKSITKADIMNPAGLPAKLEPLFREVYTNPTNSNADFEQKVNNILQQLSLYTQNVPDYANKFIPAAINGRFEYVLQWLKEGGFNLSDYTAQAEFQGINRR